MSLKNLVGTVPPTHYDGHRCILQKFVDTLDNDEAAALVALLNDPVWPTNTLRNAVLAEHPAAPSASAFAKHRKAQCRHCSLVPQAVC